MNHQILNPWKKKRYYKSETEKAKGHTVNITSKLNVNSKEMSV